MAPFRDDNPGVPADERYKAVVRTRDLWALASADGLRWRLLQKDPISTARPFDSFNVSFWDPWREEYVAYTRGKAGTEGSFVGPTGGTGGVRWIRRTTSKDFRNWILPEDIDTWNSGGDVSGLHGDPSGCVSLSWTPISTPSSSTNRASDAAHRPHPSRGTLRVRAHRGRLPIGLPSNLHGRR